MTSHILVFAFLLAICFLSWHSSLCTSSVLAWRSLFWLFWLYHAYGVSLVNSGRVRPTAYGVFMHPSVSAHLSTVVHAWELVLSKARTKLELKRVLVLLLFWLDVISVKPEDTCVKTWKFPSLAREAGVGVALSSCSAGVCLFGMHLYGLVLWSHAVLAGTCSKMLLIFPLFCFFPLKILFYFGFILLNYCDLESI